MRTRKTFLLLALLVLLLPRCGNAAQTVVAPVTLPIHGHYTFPILGSSGNPDELYVLDTFTGNANILTSSDRGISAPLWNLSGDRIAVQQGQIGSSIWHLPSNSSEVLASLPTTSTLYYPQGWSSDGSQILYRTYEYNAQPLRYQLWLYNLSNGTWQTLFSFEQGQLLDGLLPLPGGFNNVRFYELLNASWNPVYQDWIIFQLLGIPPDDQSEVGVIVNILYNRQTNEKFLLDALVGEETTYIQSPTWSPDGNYLFLNSPSLDDAIFRFSDTDHTFQLVNQIDKTEGQVIFDWLGVEDLLLTVGTDSSQDTIFYVAQILNEKWRSTEFFRLDPTTVGYIQDGDWHITASDEEKQKLACLFKTCDTVPNE